jgi:aminopeptidase N
MRIICLLGFLWTLSGPAIAGGHLTYTGAPARWARDSMGDPYRGSAPKINDLVHTRLDVRFDYKKRYLNGKAWVTLVPHFFPTDSLRLDARGMDIHSVSLDRAGSRIPLTFRYDGLILNIHLDRVYRHDEKYTVFIDYTAKPYELPFKDSSLIPYCRGLYFVNPDSTEPDKPVQIYTQGETENSSVWFPTIDKPNQKTTSEISMTVPSKYMTLSNGRLAVQKDNADGTRTDTWKMELPNPPYLFMMTVGDFRVYHDHWRDKAVDYYLEPAWAPYAKQIFGVTPEAIEYFSNVLHYPFPWNKYDQIVVRDYGSGGMENTTATLMNEYMLRTPRELLDAYYDKANSTIIHELFHQWFGALVTCESWSNQALDETFAEFSDGLWSEHHYGQDAGDDARYQDLSAYLGSQRAHTLPLVRYHYDNELDVFDIVTYCKGSNILNMLRHYLGDSAFFGGLHRYLTANAFKSAEVDQLRLAMEEVCGEDLHWFFDQWYFRPGHPVLDISYHWDEGTHTQTVYLQQTQKDPVFRLPMAIDIYTGTSKKRYSVWMNDRADTLTFQTPVRPDLVNVDAEKVLVAAVTDHRTLEEYAYQYLHAPLYRDRIEAINAAAATLSDKRAQAVLMAALHDKYYGLRILAMNALDSGMLSAAAPVLSDLALHDTSTLARAAAIRVLGRLKKSEYMPIFDRAMESPSYAVEGAGLTAMSLLDKEKALRLAEKLEKDSRGELMKAIKGLRDAR